MKPSPANGSAGLTPLQGAFLHATVVVTGAVILVIEILGARMLTPFFGTSHFVWSAQIAVTMLALAFGYRFGGMLADNPNALSRLFQLILAASVYLVATVNFRVRMATACLSLSLPIGSTVAALALFFVPLVLLAATGPVVVRSLTSSIGNMGRQVGRLSALGTFGSVGGVGLTSYVLIPHVRDSYAMMGTAVALAVLALLYLAVWGRSKESTAIAAAIALLVGFVNAPDALRNDQVPVWPGFRELYRTNSHFGMMQVVEAEKGRARYYLNDFLIQNSYDTQERKSISVFTEMLVGLSQAYSPKFRRGLCLGMGVGIAPMRLVEEGLKVDVVEINPAVVPLAQSFFGFDPGKVNLVIDDARHFLSATTGRYDTIQLDAFLGDSMPSHLMTQESFQLIRSHLEEGGTLVINAFVHFERGKDFLAGSLYKTLKSVFRDVVIHELPGANVFYVASDRDQLTQVRPPDFSKVHRFVRSDTAVAYANRVSVRSNAGIVLTDDFNPADYLDAANREETRRRLTAMVFKR